MQIIRHYRGADFIAAIARSPLSVSSTMRLLEKCQACTLVYEITEDKITSAVSLCSDNDQFSRATGRMVAFTRLAAKPATVDNKLVERYFSPAGIVSPLVNFTHLNPQLFATAAFNAAIVTATQA